MFFLSKQKLHNVMLQYAREWHPWLAGTSLDFSCCVISFVYTGNLTTVLDVSFHPIRSLVWEKTNVLIPMHPSSTHRPHPSLHVLIGCSETKDSEESDTHPCTCLHVVILQDFISKSDVSLFFSIFYMCTLCFCS